MKDIFSTINLRIFTYLSLYNSFTLSHIHSSLYLTYRTLRAHRLLFSRLIFVSCIRFRRLIMSRLIVVSRINWWRRYRRWMRILTLIVWYFDFLFNLNSCNSLKILMLRETSILFNVFFVNNEKCVWLLVNEFEWSWKRNDWSSKQNKLYSIEFLTWCTSMISRLFNN
jgi:hypothetical protein